MRRLKRVTAEAALEALSVFLRYYNAQLPDGNVLNDLERSWMKTVRKHVACARLVGVPEKVEDVWQTYAFLYITYLDAVGKMPLPCTVFCAFTATPSRAFETVLVWRNDKGGIRMMSLPPRHPSPSKPQG